MIHRREFITLIGGAAAWPLAASGQQPQRTRRIGILLAVSERELEYQAGLAALVQALGQFGWIEGRNIDIFTKWAGSGWVGLRPCGRGQASDAAYPDRVRKPGPAAGSRPRKTYCSMKSAQR